MTEQEIYYHQAVKKLTESVSLDKFAQVLHTFDVAILSKLLRGEVLSQEDFFKTAEHSHSYWIT